MTTLADKLKAKLIKKKSVMLVRFLEVTRTDYTNTLTS